MRLLIAQDEPQIARWLQSICREILGDSLQALRVATDFEAVAKRLTASPIDALLLDLNLRGADGMELLRNSVAESFQTIVMSANTERAFEAFELGVCDFLSKPFTRERLAQALRRVGQASGRGAHGARRLAVRKHGRIELVAVDHVLYVQGAGNYAELVLADGRRELHDKTLEKIGAALPPDFERIHRSYLARLSSIRALHASEGSHYEAELRNGVRLPVGRTRYKELREKLG